MTLADFIARCDNLKTSLSVEIDKYMTEMVTNLYNTLNLRVFTRHIDFDGAKFIQYTPGYAKWKAKKYPSKFTGERNFELTGNMKANFKMFKAGDLLYTIGWMDSDLEKLAGYNSDAAKQASIISLADIERTKEIEKFNKKVTELFRTILTS